MRQESPNSLRGLIKRALQSARMEDANFSTNWNGQLPKDKNEVTEFIKKRTENYRNSWIIKPLESALEKIEKKKK